MEQTIKDNPMNRKSVEVFIMLAFAFVIIGLIGSLFILDSPEERRIILPCLVGAVMGLVAFAGFLVVRRDGSDPNAPKVVASLPDEISASSMVQHLEANGIKARSVGGYTSGFQTEVAGDVRVVVAANEYEAAMKVIQ